MHPGFVVDWSTTLWSVACAFAAVLLSAAAALWSTRSFDVVDAPALD